MKVVGSVGHGVVVKRIVGNHDPVSDITEGLDEREVAMTWRPRRMRDENIPRLWTEGRIPREKLSIGESFFGAIEKEVAHLSVCTSDTVCPCVEITWPSEIDHAEPYNV
jgi:hypothetical protein